MVQMIMILVIDLPYVSEPSLRGWGHVSPFFGCHPGRYREVRIECFVDRDVLDDGFFHPWPGHDYPMWVRALATDAETHPLPATGSFATVDVARASMDPVAVVFLLIVNQRTYYISHRISPSSLLGDPGVPGVGLDDY